MIYIDDTLRPAAGRNGRRVVRGRWSHLWADTSQELHEFAAQLGLKHAWVQKPATVFEHYVITAGKRAQALELGAIPISDDEYSELTQCRRVGVPFDVYLLRRDSDQFHAQLERARAALSGQAGSAPEGPRRLQLRRSPGWRLPPNAVSVAAPTKWANPFRPARRSVEANHAAVDRYREYLAANPDLIIAVRIELTGKDLACWCPLPDAHPQLRCHADVLLHIANPPLS